MNSCFYIIKCPECRGRLNPNFEGTILECRLCKGIGLLKVEEKPKWRLYGGHSVTSMYARPVNKEAGRYFRHLPGKYKTQIYAKFLSMEVNMHLTVIDIHKYKNL